MGFQKPPIQETVHLHDYVIKTSNLKCRYAILILLLSLEYVYLGLVT